MSNGADRERDEILGLPSLLIRRKRADLITFHIITSRASINSLNFLALD